MNNFKSKKTNIPFHVSIIPDGGRRWAVRNGYSYREAYTIMADKAYILIDYLFNYGVKIISVFFSSTYNFKRPDSEIFDFCTAEAEFLSTKILSLASKKKIQIIIVGNKENLPEYLINACNLAQKETQTFSTYKLYICINYSSINEITNAVEESLKSEDTNFLSRLWVPHFVDLFVRTGNACVMSDFLTVQSAYARFFFNDKMFNDFTVDDLKKMLDLYANLELKYGE